MKDLVILDTDFLSYYLIAHAAALTTMESLLQNAVTVATTVINKAEMFFGAYKKNWGSKRMSSLRKLFDSIEVIEFDAQAAEIYGQLRSDLQNRGIDVGFADTVIASIAWENDAAVVTGNVVHFRRISGLLVIPFII